MLFNVNLESSTTNHIFRTHSELISCKLITNEMQLLFHLVYYHSTCFGHSLCSSSGVVYKTVEAATSVCQCVWGGICKCNNDFIKNVCVLCYCV